MCIRDSDYSIRGEGTRVLMFSDRLEVYSPGRLPGHVTLANLKDERYSRNEAIVAVLSDMGYIEPVSYTHLDVYKRQPTGRNWSVSQ